MAQGSEFPLRKPPGFHWDFLLLGITTFVAGLIGVPAPNGLIPQAPIHTRSLLVLGPHAKSDDALLEEREKGTTMHEDQYTGRVVPLAVVCADPMSSLFSLQRAP